MRGLLAGTLAVAAACGGTGGAPVDGNGGGSGDGPGSDGAVEEMWTPLIQRSWSLAAGEPEAWRCRRIKIEQDMWISAFRAISPPGTHHEILTISESTDPTPSGDFDCDGGNIDKKMLFGGGAGTGDVVFPTGVAMKLTAGQYIKIQLHVHNVTDDPLTGTSGILVKTIDAADVVHQADVMLAGTIDSRPEIWSIPNNGQPYDIAGGCVAPMDWHVMTMWPHMHKLGVRQQVRILHNSNFTPLRTLLDATYDFEEQRNYSMDTLIAQDEVIEVRCTYINNTNGPVTLGDSESSEMCFTGMYKWPAGTNIRECVEPYFQ